MPGTCRVQQQTRSFNCIPADNDCFSFLFGLPAISVKVRYSSHASVLAKVNPGYHAVVPNLRAMFERIGNVRYQRALFSAYFAALNTKAPVDAMRSVTVRAREDSDGAAYAYPDV